MALLQDRPVLGGNASSEVRIWPEGKTNLKPYPRIGDIVNELLPPVPKQGNMNGSAAANFDDARKLEVVGAEPRITLLTGHRAVGVETRGKTITAFVVQCTRTARQLRLAGSLFADCTGDAVAGHLAGADHDYEPRDLLGSSNLFSVLDASKREEVLRCECKDKSALAMR